MHTFIRFERHERFPMPLLVAKYVHTVSFAGMLLLSLPFLRLVTNSTNQKKKCSMFHPKVFITSIWFVLIFHANNLQRILLQSVRESQNAAIQEKSCRICVLRLCQVSHINIIVIDNKCHCVSTMESYHFM